MASLGDSLKVEVSISFTPLLLAELFAAAAAAKSALVYPTHAYPVC
ncbi:MAG: hypothetical protein HY301_18015 [Verrucomicrobia bacterium]|nr:hypothetical protein [Verrucomicrobiota bacterium]